MDPRFQAGGSRQPLKRDIESDSRAAEEKVPWRVLDASAPNGF